MYLFNLSAKIIVTKQKAAKTLTCIKFTFLHYIIEKEGKFNLIENSEVDNHKDFFSIIFRFSLMNFFSFKLNIMNIISKKDFMTKD